ncbi:hypothetical protein GJ744_006977 [Endocarpon pusillum]|uniref:F-box domain-containing protein n=1 Tax=Endocarpon pusillum TaxID=364733 RepID=A0A8H7E802_9EURO|nr:hypothetical protein GJ744_006977 [Endocarpon pusillum]
MPFQDLAPEIILTILRNCSSITDLVNLFRSCRRIHSMLSTSQKTSMLYHVAEIEFGPLHDAFQLLTLNNSQPAHLIRDPPRSHSLLRQVIAVGRVAKKWEDIYPLCKWDSDFVDRRSLSGDERYRLRRAIYRYWLYTHAFHTPAYPRTSRRIPQLVIQRVQLLHNWSTRELFEIDDFQATLRALIGSRICPSDSAVQAIGHGDGEYPEPSSVKRLLTTAAQDLFHTSRDGHMVHRQDRYHMNVSMGWGDPITHYYIIEDLLKLDPKAVLWLYDHSQKWQVEGYLNSLGEWFCNNGDTFSETLTCVLQRREIDLVDRMDTCVGII